MKAAMKEVNELIRQRYSCRDFELKEVSLEDFMVLIDSARRAPSGKNGQPWRFIVVKDEKVKEKIAKESIYENWIKFANGFIVVYLDKDKSYNYKKDCQGIGAAIENICLQATAMDIGSCWIGEILQKENEVNSIIGVPDNYELMAVVCIGYAKTKSKSLDRLNLDEIIYKII